MYTPAYFAENRPEVLHELIRACPLATLVIHSPEAGLIANHIPLLLTPEGTLQGHIARANSLWKLVGPDTEALVIFQTSDAYVTPGWYPTKQETGRVVPTWNYAVVHAHGPLRVVNDATWLLRQIEQLTTQQEAGSVQPWQLGDAPAGYVEGLLNAIIGIEIQVTSLHGKLKASQNQPERNRAGVVAGLGERQRPLDAAMAELVAGAK